MTARSITLVWMLAVTALATEACDSPTATEEACAGLPTAPQSARVDLGQPSFSNPTNVTNPLFPVSGLGRVLLMGNVDGVPLRVETTLMPGTRTIDLDGRSVEVLVSQYVATGSGGDLEAVALAVPTDALPGPVPAELKTLSAGADSIFDAAQVGGWSAASALLGIMTTAWNTFQAGSVPPTLRTQMNGALVALGSAVQAQNVGAARQASVDVDQASLDLQLRHRSVAQVDLELLDLWARQLLVDAAAGDQGAVLGDAATLKWIRDRLAPDVTYEPELSRIDAPLGGLRAAAAARDLAAAAEAATRLRHTLRLCDRAQRHQCSDRQPRADNDPSHVSILLAPPMLRFLSIPRCSFEARMGTGRQRRSSWADPSNGSDSSNGSILLIAADQRLHLRSFVASD